VACACCTMPHTTHTHTTHTQHTTHALHTHTHTPQTPAHTHTSDGHITTHTPSYSRRSFGASSQLQHTPACTHTTKKYHQRTHTDPKQGQHTHTPHTHQTHATPRTPDTPYTRTRHTHCTHTRHTRFFNRSPTTVAKRTALSRTCVRHGATPPGFQIRYVPKLRTGAIFLGGGVRRRCCLWGLSHLRW
jgi:hypothetical protein